MATYQEIKKFLQGGMTKKEKADFEKRMKKSKNLRKVVETVGKPGAMETLDAVRRSGLVEKFKSIREDLENTEADAEE